MSQRSRDSTRPRAVPRAPFVVGILGGIASGKSRVARVLGDAGFLVLDADRVAREVLEHRELRAPLIALLGAEIEQAGTLDRARIARIVFADPARLAALEDLLHPRVRRELVQRLEAGLAAGRSVVLDVPLLLEKGLIDRCDYVIFVEVAEETRRERAVARGMPEADWRAREASQASIQAKRAAADRIIDNNGTIAAVERALADLIAAGRRGPT